MATIFDKNTIEKVNSVFDVKEVYSNDTGDIETIFVPKEGISAQAKEEGLTSLRSLMAYENPDIVESANKTGVEQASNASFPEFYRGTDMGRADVAAEIADEIADSKNVDEVLKAYSYNLTDDNNIVFVPRGEQDTTRAKEILNANFNMTPVQLGNYEEGLAPMAGEQDRVIEFMTGKPSQTQDSTEQAMAEAFQNGDIEALAKQLNDIFFAFGTLLDAKKGVTGEQVKEAQEKLNPYFQTTLVKSGERISGLRPVPSQENTAKVMYQIMYAVKNAQSIEKLYPELIKNQDVQAAVQEIVNSEPAVEDEPTPFVLGSNNKDVSSQMGTASSMISAPKPVVIPTAVNTEMADSMSMPAMGLKEGPLPAPTGTIPDEVDENASAKTFTDYVGEYMASLGDDQTRTSDENEVFFDAMRYAALNQAGEKFGDLLSLKAGERSESLKRIIGNLSGKKMKEYQGRLEAGKMAALEALPPKKLALLSDVVGTKLSKAKEGSDEHKALQTQLANIDARIDAIITDYVGSEIVIDQNNVADAYEGMMAILATRDPKNETIQKAHEMLRVTINGYDNSHNLMGLTPKDDRALTARFDALVGKMPIDNFDIKKLGGLLKGVPIAKDVAMALNALQFTDDKDNVVAQKNENGEIIVGSELDMLRQISIADTVTALVTEKGTLTPETVAEAFNSAVKNNIVNLLVADLTSKGVNLTRETVMNAWGNVVQGQSHKVSQDVMTGFVAGNNNDHMGFINRLAAKVGKESSIAKKLFAPIKGIDALAEKRFGPLYTKAKGLAKVLGGNTARAVLMGAVSKVALIAGGPALAVGVSAAMTAARYWKIRRAEVKNAKAQDKPVPSFGSFLKRNATGMVMSTVSMTAMAVGLPIVNMAVAGTNISRSVLSTFRQSRKGNFTRWQSFRRALTGTIPTAVAMATMAATGEYMDSAAQGITNMFTDTPNNLPDVAPTPTEVKPVTISEQDLANNIIDGTPIPGIPNENIPVAEEVPETQDSMKTEAHPQTCAVGSEVVGDTTLTHHAYSQEAHDLAHARLHGEGVYDTAGRHAVPQNFNDAQLNQALSSVKEVAFGHPELQGPDGQSNAEILLYKLVQMNKLTGSDMDLQNGHEVGEHFGVKDSAGQLHTPQSLLKDLMSGKPVDAEVAAQILGKVENGVSAEGHFLEDIKNFKEAGTWSYRPGASAGWTEAHDTPAPIAPGPVVTQEPTPTPAVPAQKTEDSDYNPFEDPTIAIQPDQPEAPTAVTLPEPGNTVSPDSMLYFIPADELWKAPVLQDRIGALPKKKQVEAKGTQPTSDPKAMETIMKALGKEDKKTNVSKTLAEKVSKVPEMGKASSHDQAIIKQFHNHKNGER